MGEEIIGEHFTRDDFHRFSARLREETRLLGDWLQSGRLADEPPRIGYELEAWLVDRHGRPAPRNAELLQRLGDPMVVHELAQFNMELNGMPLPLADQPFRGMQRDLQERWTRCAEVAAELDLRPLMIGILPSARPQDLCVQHMSPRQRYRALNEQVLRLRNWQPITLDIERDGESIHLQRTDVMLEAAATSLQIHLQLTSANAARCFNAAVIMSAATVAVAANSPWLFGHGLWEETRIPLFEQAVAVEPPGGASDGRLQRVTFGTGYARDALYGLFVENRQHYAVLLPELSTLPPGRLPHLRLHNGTIWRWNRPLVGFDEQGQCHLRLEHRVMAAGPTVVDVTANAVFFHGLIQACLRRASPLESVIPFAAARNNFYCAARDGLAAEVDWEGGVRAPLRDLILDHLLPEARRGLDAVGLQASEYMSWLKVIEERVRSGRTGAAWQRLWVERHGHDMDAMVSEYARRQFDGAPVHEWSL